MLLLLLGLKEVNSIGFDAVNVETDKDLEILLAGIDITKVKINFLMAKCFFELTKKFVAFVKG